MRYLPDPQSAAKLGTDALRAAFLVTNIFQPGRITLELVDLDRVVIGGAVPTDAPLTLEAPADFLSSFFTERRELGVLNIGGAGSVTVDGARHALGKKDVLYVGRGSRNVVFASDDAGTPAKFYLVSYLAHANYPTTRAAESDVFKGELGNPETANKRTIRRYIHRDGVQSAQLVMGVTTLATGSVWNTMPCHTHHRRTEIYLYFDLPEDAILLHLMGEPNETRTLVVRDGDVALSPGWSVHAGCATTAYSFCWAMGGENQDYADMQAVSMRDLR